MSEKTSIAWTDHTFNLAWGCAKVSPGCAHCYAEAMSARYGHSAWGPLGVRRTFGQQHWAEPLRWHAAAQREGQRRRVFCSSMCDIFEEHPVIEAELKKLWPLIRATPALDWQLLTKRAERIAECLPPDWGAGCDNVWLGVSIENNDYAWRADWLRSIPARVRFVSYEPALGSLDRLDLAGISWLIFGGESGPGFRSENKQWARDMRDRCRASGVAFFYKQSANIHSSHGILLDGELVREFPVPQPNPRARRLQRTLL